MKGKLKEGKTYAKSSDLIPPQQPNLHARERLSRQEVYPLGAPAPGAEGDLGSVVLRVDERQSRRLATEVLVRDLDGDDGVRPPPVPGGLDQERLLRHHPGGASRRPRTRRDHDERVPPASSCRLGRVKGTDVVPFVVAAPEDGMLEEVVLLARGKNRCLLYNFFRSLFMEGA